MSDDDDLGTILERTVAESVELRLGAQLPSVYEATGILLDALLDVRQRLDRLEELLTQTLRLRGMAGRRLYALRSEADDALDSVLVRLRNSGVRDEYSSAKERLAAANLEVIDLRRLERTADQQFRRCDEAVDGLRLRLRGLQEIRQDILAIVKIRQFESALDR